MNRDTLRQLITVAVLAATIAINSIAGAVGINGANTGEISDRYPALFVPAGYVFSIWSVIYLGLIAYAVWQALPAQRGNPVLRRIAPWFIAGCAFNICWIFLWHYGYFFLTVLMMTGLLVTLIGIYLILGIGRIHAPTRERYFVHLPFSIYLAWITVATVANVTTWLYSIGWSGWGISETIWALIMLVVAALVAIAVSLRHADIAYVAVIVWAFVGITVRQSDTLLVAGAASLLAGVVALTLLISVPNRRRNMAESIKLS